MTTSTELDQIEAVKDAFLSGAEPKQAASSDLLDSWRRSREILGMPAQIRDVPHVPLDMLDMSLLDIFQAPLERVSTDLSGSGLALLVADAKGRILQRWTGDVAASRHLDAVGTDRGAVLAEDAVGTNGVGTVAATGRSVQIYGSEHYADIYARCVCTGSPIRHPLTKDLLGVVTISSDLNDRSVLLRTLVNTIAAQLEQQVLGAQHPRARAILDAFIETSRTAAGPVVAFGPQGLTMQSQKAARLTAADIAALQQLSSGARRSGRYFVELSGSTVEVQLNTLDDGAGTILTLQRDHRSSTTSIGPARPQLIGRSPDFLADVNTVARYRELRRPVIVAGEPGAGKTSVALGLPHRVGTGISSSVVIDAAERHVLGSRRWLQLVAERINASAAIVVRSIEKLDQPATAGLVSLIENAQGRGPILLTATAPTREEADRIGIELGLPVVWISPLRERRSDLLPLWQFFAGRFAPGAGLTLRPEAIEALSSYDWPRNLKELRALVEDLAVSGKRGPVHASDIPEHMRASRPLSMIERAELDAIRRALQEAEGNRTRAADILGLSRATIYRKMKMYRITE